MRSLLLTLLLVSPCSLPAAEDDELFTGTNLKNEKPDKE